MIGCYTESQWAAYVEKGISIPANGSMMIPMDHCKHGRAPYQHSPECLKTCFGSYGLVSTMIGGPVPCSAFLAAQDETAHGVQKPKSIGLAPEIVAMHRMARGISS